MLKPMQSKPWPASAGSMPDTMFLLIWQYGPQVVVPIDLAARDYFPHLTPENLTRKILSGAIALPLLRIEDSRESAKGIHLLDLAQWIEARAEVARRVCQQIKIS